MRQMDPLPRRSVEKQIKDQIHEFGASTSRTGIWIRAHLQEVGMDYIWSMFRQYRAFAQQVPFKPGSYNSFRVMIYILKKLHLVKEAKREPSERKGLAERVFYQLIEENMYSSAWESPSGAYKERPVSS